MSQRNSNGSLNHAPFPNHVDLKKGTSVELGGWAIAEDVNRFDARVGSLQLGQNLLHEDVNTVLCGFGHLKQRPCCKCRIHHALSMHEL